MGPGSNPQEPSRPIDFDVAGARAVENFYQRRALPELSDECGNPDQVIANWGLLMKQPLPARNAV
jgi:hypothetical protein